MIVSELKCVECGTGRAVPKNQNPDDPCDMCGSEDWERRYDREVVWPP